MLEFSYRGSYEIDDYLSYYYIHTYPNLKKHNELIPVDKADSCREFFVKAYRYAITNGDISSLDVKKAYVLISYGACRNCNFDELNAKIQNDAAKGLYIVNSFEKTHKWPLTKLYPVKCKNVKIPMVFFSGPRKWTISPYLMSIWSLAIRLGRNNWLPKKLLSLDHENLVRQVNISTTSAEGEDARQIKATFGKWDEFMSLYTKLFAGIDRKEHWSKTPLKGRNDRPEGIYRLMDGTTGHKELYKKYTDLLNEGGGKDFRDEFLKTGGVSLKSKA